MAKVTGPLMSMSASGSLGKTIVFGSNKGRPYVRQHVVPSNPQSAGQTGTRSMMRWASQEWAQLSTLAQATWQDRASQNNVSPFNSFVQVAMSNWAGGKGAVSTDPPPALVTPAAPTAPTDSVAGKEVTITWVDPVGATAFGLGVHVSLTTGFTPGPSNAVLVVDASVQTATFTQKTSGTYFYVVRAFSESGTFGPPTAEGSFIVP